MCGIAGFIDYWERHPIDPATRGCLLKDMNDVIRHRGPDDDGFFLKDGVALGMRRLAIIDLAGGAQPMSGEDGTVSIVFNGEIYSFQELRPVLEKRGHTFKTHSDTETIVHAYEEYGEACVNHLRGMFTFAIWDDKKRAGLHRARSRRQEASLLHCHDRRHARVRLRDQVAARTSGCEARNQPRSGRRVSHARLRSRSADDFSRRTQTSARTLPDVLFTDVSRFNSTGTSTSNPRSRANPKIISTSCAPS